jgi:hypothetical protein
LLFGLLLLVAATLVKQLRWVYPRKHINYGPNKAQYSAANCYASTTATATLIFYIIAFAPAKPLHNFVLF